jgi:hypothetical protein
MKIIWDVDQKNSQAVAKKSFRPTFKVDEIKDAVGNAVVFQTKNNSSI